MATTSPDNLRTPNPGDPYNLVADLATLASDTQVALNKKVSNLLTGTAAQRVAATGTATAGMLWQDTDSIKMIWRKDGASWVPAVWRWAGTTAQRDGFTQAPNGFEWIDPSTGIANLRLGGLWVTEGGDIPSGSWFTPASGHTLSPYTRVQFVGGMIIGTLVITRSGGFTPGQVVGTVSSGFRPVADTDLFTMVSQGGASGTGLSVIGTGGVVTNWTNLPGNTRFTVSVNYPVR